MGCLCAGRARRRLAPSTRAPPSAACRRRGDARPRCAPPWHSPRGSTIQRQLGPLRRGQTCLLSFIRGSLEMLSFFPPVTTGGVLDKDSGPGPFLIGPSASPTLFPRLAISAHRRARVYPARGGLAPGALGPPAVAGGGPRPQWPVPAAAGGAGRPRAACAGACAGAGVGRQREQQGQGRGRGRCRGRGVGSHGREKHRRRAQRGAGMEPAEGAAASAFHAAAAVPAVADRAPSGTCESPAKGGPEAPSGKTSFRRSLSAFRRPKSSVAFQRHSLFVCVRRRCRRAARTGTAPMAGARTAARATATATEKATATATAAAIRGSRPRPRLSSFPR